MIAYCLVSVSVWAQQIPVALPDEIFYNGKIVTVDRSFSIQQAFAVKGEEILAVGSNAAVRPLAGPNTRLTDLRGHTVIPGLIDNHNHQHNMAMLEYRGVNLSGIKSLEEMFGRIRQAVARVKPGEAVITTAGWTENGLAEKRAPTRQELDEVAPNNVLVIQRGRGTAYLNSAALKAAGITRQTERINGIEIPKDSNGEPTGRLRVPSVINPVVGKIVPPAPVKEQEEMLRKVQDQQLAMGLTTIRDLELPPDGMRAYQSLRRSGNLAMRVSMGLGVASGQWEHLEELLEPWGVGPGFGDHWLRLDCIAEFAVDSSATAHFREPKLNPPGDVGYMRITPEQLRHAMLTINRYGWRPSIHISGDRALDYVLDAYEAANAESSIRNMRWIVEHIPYAQPDQMERMARLGVLVSAQIQPYRGGEGARRNLGPERAERAVPMRELLDHNLVVSTGSDFPGRNNNPFLNIYFYTTRKTATGGVSGVAQKISREEALRVATVNNAYMTYEEDVKGSLEPGKLADFVILSADVMTVPDEEILNIKPLATYVGGKKRYSAPNGGF